MPVDGNSPVPIFQQIAGDLRRSIAAGLYRVGEKLPSTRSLALELGVNPNTVQRAFDELEREKFIEVKRGVGLFVTQQGVDEAHRHAARGLDEALRQTIAAARFAGLSSADIESIFRSAIDGTPPSVQDPKGADA